MVFPLVLGRPGYRSAATQTRTGSTIGGVSDHPDLDQLGHPVFDADNHYYEALDAFTRHLDPALGPRCVQWCEIDGRRYHVLGGRVSKAVTNPTFDPIAMPGAMYDYFRGNPDGRNPLEFLAAREPIRPAYREPERPAGHPRRAGPGRLLAVPDPGHDLRGAVAARSRGGVPHLPGLQPLAGRGLGLRPPPIASTPRPYLTLADADWAVDELTWALDAGRPHAS